MKAEPKIQYTIRQVPPQVDAALRQKARQENRSLNEVALDALKLATGQSQEPVRYHDLDFMFGTWVEDPEFDKIMKEQDQVHPDDWK